MRIGEIAALAGVTSRAVRHYHQLGLLPEPERRPNGYRAYGLRHAVELARIRRLTELGLGLAEVKDVLADDAGRELVEVLEELDGDLARQEAAVRERRARLAELLDRARAGELPPEGPVSPELGRIFAAFGPSDSPMAAKDRQHLALFDSMIGNGDGDGGTDGRRGELLAALRPLADDPEFVRRVEGMYRRLDELADAPADDPRIAPLGAELAAAMPAELLRLMSEGDAEQAVRGDFGEAFLGDFAPAQAEVVRRMIAALTERARRADGG
ncbi:MerR family transcriptional regulator [Streptomyces boluensis]|uniref:MerR family DNA-binding transcriptional regulator n=1 Tax=Streptomyces boluensis TaxID=1775135 RepID=A0A964XLQ0_9ACTN|nr:MerR family transcriptional regulator [Streptomyces boluensis]NBE52356.1 MerR family DNA-binding transcriptional regulator [Streptomyces boluensis]